MKCAAVFLAGADLAVLATVAPPCRYRSAMALPAPFVPPVTRTRLPENSFVSVAFMSGSFLLPLLKRSADEFCRPNRKTVAPSLFGKPRLPLSDASRRWLLRPRRQDIGVGPCHLWPLRTRR